MNDKLLTLTQQLCASLLVLGASLLLFTRCESPSKGCLDLEASNFDLTVDKPCEDDCCKYPKLSITMNQEYNGAIWKENEPYLNSLGQPFRIKSVAFYLSDFKLGQSGSDYTVSDSVRMGVFGATPGDTLQRVFRNDFILVRRLPVEYSAGTFRKGGVFDAFSCQLGLSTAANTIVPRKAPSGHPLNKQPDSLWLSRSEGYVWMQIVLNRDTAANAPVDTLRFTAADFGGQPITIAKFNGIFTHTTGFDFKVIIKTNYAILMNGVDFANTGINDWKMKILQNLNATFELQ